MNSPPLYFLSAHNGTVIDARNSRTYPGLANEAIERRAVTLDAVGKYVEFTVPRSANSIVVRYAIPDSADGTGLTAPIGLYINGAKQPDLIFTSKYSWIYGTYPFNNNPGDVRPHHFYDEADRLAQRYRRRILELNVYEPVDRAYQVRYVAGRPI